MNIQVKVVSPLFDQLKLDLPTRGSEKSAGLDLRACIEREVVLAPGEKLLIGTGLAMQAINAGTPLVGLVFVRSGLGAGRGVGLANAVGVIDEDYQGEIKVALINHSGRPQSILPGDRIAQIVYLRVFMSDIVRVEEFDSQTARGSGGFGSTGRS